MPWWGWVLLGAVAYLAVGWWWVARADRRERTNWVAGMERRIADPVDEAFADWRAALAPDGSHDRCPHLTDEQRRIFFDYCESMWRADIERSTT